MRRYTHTESNVLQYLSAGEADPLYDLLAGATGLKIESITNIWIAEPAGEETIDLRAEFTVVDDRTDHALRHAYVFLESGSTPADWHLRINAAIGDLSNDASRYEIVVLLDGRDDDGPPDLDVEWLFDFGIRVARLGGEFRSFLAEKSKRKPWGDKTIVV